ncbi:hypothetical protein [Sphingobium yanoikuyae]
MDCQSAQSARGHEIEMVERSDDCRIVGGPKAPHSRSSIMFKYVAIRQEKGRWHVSAESGRVGDPVLNLENGGYASRMDALQAAMIYAQDNRLDIVEMAL